MFMHSKKRSQLRFKAKIFNALSDPMRLGIIDFLRGGEKCVCEIVPYLDLIQPVVSRHLKILKDCGILKYRKDGNRRLYSIADPRIFEIVDGVDSDLVDALTKRIIEQIV